jgi:hypothetical protein
MPEDKIDDAGQWVYLKGDRVFVLDCEDDLTPLPVRVISQRDLTRCHHLAASFHKEQR